MIQLKLGPNTFTVAAMKPRRSFPLQAKIWPIVIEIAGLLAKISTLSEKEKKDEAPEEGADVVGEMPKRPFAAVKALFEKDIEEILPLVSGAFSSIEYEDLAFLQKELLSETLADGQRLFSEQSGVPSVFDSVLVGRTLDTWRLMWAAVKVTYPDFLAPLLARVGRAEGAVASAA